VSVSSSLPLSLVTAPSAGSRSAVRGAARSLTEFAPPARGSVERGLAERGLVQNALGPDERLLGMLQGHDARGPVTWLVTNARLIRLSPTRPDDALACVPTSAITCVEVRTDPTGTWLRVRATGHQFTLTHDDASQAAQFSHLLRERAGIGSGQAPARRCAGPRDSMRAGFNGLTPHSPR
jgi:hypothetical protein